MVCNRHELETIKDLGRMENIKGIQIDCSNFTQIEIEKIQQVLRDNDQILCNIECMWRNIQKGKAWLRLSFDKHCFGIFEDKSSDKLITYGTFMLTYRKPKNNKNVLEFIDNNL